MKFKYNIIIYMVKTCTRCLREYNIDQFPIVNSTKNKRSSMDLNCKREYDREYYKNYSAKRKNEKYIIQKKRLNSIRKYIYEYMKDKKCIDCEENRIPALDFDHISNKEFNISNGVKNGYSLKRIKNEIEKCEIRCANCHRVSTSKLLNWYKFK